MPGLKSNEDRLKMEKFGTSMAEYSNTLTDMNRALKEAESRKEKLQSVLEMKCQRRAKLHAKVDEHEVQEQVKEKQERTALESIEQLNKELEVAKEQLEGMKTQNDKLKKLRLNHVCHYEEEMRGLSEEFMSMQLLEEGDQDAMKDIPKELSDLEGEVARLQERYTALLSDSSSHLQLDTFLSLESECNEFLEKVKRNIRQVRDEERTLKEELELMRKKSTSAPA